MANFLNEAQQRHFVRWPILGVYTWPNPSPLATTFPGEIDNLKQWVRDRTVWMDATHIFYLIDSMANFLNEAQQRHFVRWPILGVYTWPNPSPHATTFPGEIDNLKQWVRDRTVWIDANLPGNC